MADPRRSPFLQVASLPGGLASVIFEAQPEPGPEEARRRPGVWARCMILPNELAAWLKAGLRSHELALILDLREARIPREALTWTVRRETMLDRIRVRVPAEVLDHLRRAGFADLPDVGS